MKKYIVKFKGSEKVFGEYASKEEASKRLIEYFNDYNDDICVDFASPFDFTLEEVECKEVNEEITDFDTARKVLGVKPNMQIKDAERLVSEINPKHLEALIALNKLFTIAEDWNKEDGFVPDFSNGNQCKYFPWFIYNNAAAGFVLADTINMPAYANANLGSRLCFKSSARAEQFGKQFEELYNKVFL